MKHRLLTFAAAMLLVVSAFGQASIKRHIFEEAYDAAQAKGNIFKAGSSWVPYPAYSDREAWAELAEGNEEYLIKIGEKYLKHQWRPMLASEYLEYEKTGNRSLGKKDEGNKKAIVALTIAELVEGKGRFLMPLLDGLYMQCQVFSWCHPQHTKSQDSRRTLPRKDWKHISLHSANCGATIAFALYFFEEEFRKMDPYIPELIKATLKEFIMDPFLDESKDGKPHWWTGFNRRDNRLMNNWTPYCTAHAITPFLLFEEDEARLTKALKRSAQMMDMYMNDVRSDGACDEGPSYWSMAVGKVYDYARMMCDASGGKMNVLEDHLIRRMGEFKSKTYFTDGWVQNYADGTARNVGDVPLLYRYGVDTKSQELVDFSIYCSADPSKRKFKPLRLTFGQTFRCLESLRYAQHMKKAQEKAINGCGGDWYKMKYYLRANVGSEWYNETEYSILRHDGWIMANKGGNNGESHNHNDVGSGLLYVDEIPILIDPGVGTYTKLTFSPKRYTVWLHQSDWHNVPKINGVSQIAGRQYAAKGSDCNLKKRIFTSDIAGAYPDSAACRSWHRKWTLGRGEVVISDTYSLKERKAADVENFIVRGRVYLPGQTTSSGKVVKEGEVIVVGLSYTRKRELMMRIEYPEGFTPSVTVQDCTYDKKIRNVWGDEILRISFTSAQDAPTEGKYEFRISKASEVEIVNQ